MTRSNLCMLVLAGIALALTPVEAQPAGQDQAAKKDEGQNALYRATTGAHAVKTVDNLVLEDRARDKKLQIRVTWPEMDGPCPVIVWSHGATGTKDDYQPLIRHWASHGYVCIQANHSDSRAFGHLSGPARFRDWASRPEDVAFLLDSIDTIAGWIQGLRGKLDRAAIGVGGHSFGAHTAQLVGGVTTMAWGGERRSHADKRPRAFLLISPQGKGVMMDQTSWQGLTRPAMTVTGSNDRGRQGQSWTWRLDPFRYAPPEGKYLVTVNGAYHGFGGIAGTTRYTNMGPENPEQVAWVRSVSAAFWDAYLLDSPEALAFLKSDALHRASGGTARIRIGKTGPGEKSAPRPGPAPGKENP